MKKKIDLKKITLVSKVKKIEKEVIKKSSINLDNNTKLKSIYNSIKMLFENIATLDKYSFDLLERSIETNKYISEYKFDKSTKDKIRNDNQPTFFQLMRVDSKYFKNFLDYTLMEIINDIIYLNSENECYKEFVINEIFNILNYRKTSITLLSKNDFYSLHNILKDIKNSYVDNFVLGSKKFYTKENLKLEPFKNIIKDGILYKVLYIVPNKSYGDNSKITKMNTRGIMAPVVLDTNGIPLNDKLWNCVYKINKNFKKEFPVRCLVPINLRLKHSVISMNNKLLISYFNDLVMFKDKINKKMSLLTFINIDTYYQRKYL